MKKFLSVLMCLALLLSCLTVSGLGEAAFKAGTYTAAARGFVGDVTVEVEMSDSAIVSVKVLSSEETPAIAATALEMIPQMIVNAQSLDVEAVSGATYASNAVIEAVKACVEQAGDPALLQAADASAEKKLTAGTYTATRHGHHADITVEVTCTGDAISDVKVVSCGDSINIADLACEVVTRAIVDNQSIAVDTVTGATYSSRAIVDAVIDCIGQAGGDVMAFNSKVEPEAWSTEEHTCDYDVVVVGSGMAGIAAAVTAQDAGAKVAILEKLPYYGGTSQTSFGFLAYATDEGRNSAAIEEYLMHRYNGLRQGDTYMDGLYPNPKAVKVLAEESYDALKWMETKGAAFAYLLASEVGNTLR